MGQCKEAIETLTLAHGGKVLIHGLIPPEAHRSNSNLAINRAFCLLKLGEDEHANAIN